ncbi:unnamed protein product, partial [Symbiodinium necroappetens]
EYVIDVVRPFSGETERSSTSMDARVDDDNQGSVGRRIFAQLPAQLRHRKRLYQIIPAFATFALAMKPRYHSNGNIIACRWNVKWPESITTGSERQQENSILSRFSLVFYGQLSESFVKTARSSTAPRDLRLTVLCFAGSEMQTLHHISAYLSEPGSQNRSDEDDTVKRSPSFNQKTLPDKAGPTTSGPKAPRTQRTNRQCQANGLMLW